MYRNKITGEIVKEVSRRIEEECGHKEVYIKLNNGEEWRLGYFETVFKEEE